MWFLCLFVVLSVIRHVEMLGSVAKSNIHSMRNIMIQYSDRCMHVSTCWFCHLRFHMEKNISNGRKDSEHSSRIYSRMKKTKEEKQTAITMDMNVTVLETRYIWSERM